MRPTIALSIVLLLSTATGTEAYSVLAHEAVVDAVWADGIAPLLKRKFPSSADADVRKARAYAYGGSLIQDLGYYPFGSRFFSNLVHYVRSGDFVAALVKDARTIDEYAFALGALAHYTSDDLGHPIAVNRAVPILYPKLRAKYGDEVLYADSPARHVMAEFAFDVVEVARGAFKSDEYQQRIGFEVARPVLERAFRETYGLELGDVFHDTELAIGTYRRAVSQVIPDMTRLAWREKRDEILAATPDVTERDIVYTLTRQQYEHAFGTAYRRPSLFARFIVFVSKIVPKVGPFRPLAFTPLTPEAERLFLESFAATRARCLASMHGLQTGQLPLSDVDLDTGRPMARGANRLADETYLDLLERFARRKFAAVPPTLRRDINAYYASQPAVRHAHLTAGKRDRKAARLLAELNLPVTPTRSAAR